MSDSSSSSHSLHGPSADRSLANFASHPTSPFSSQQLNADSALAPPSLMANRGGLYPTVTSGFAPEEDHVYRSVTMESPSIGAQGFDPLSSFDNSFTTHHSKDLSMNPKGAYGFAAYQPTLNFATVQTDYKPQQTQVTVTTVTTKVVPTESAAPPPQAPMWLEPNSHFFCSCPSPSTPMLLYDSVRSVLQSLHEGSGESPSSKPGPAICTIDMTPTPNLYKLSCTAYQRHSGAATPFIVRIFTSDAPSSKYCVEFQRRQGDVVQFYELFRTARTRVQAAYPCPDAPAAPKVEDALNLQSLDAALAIPQLQLRSWSAPSLPTESYSKEHMCETVRSLLAMCASPCVDIKYQGIQALADLSCSPSFNDALKTCSFDMREALISEGCFQLFLDCLPIESHDIHRASLTALANLVETQGHLCKQVVRDEKSLARLHVLTASNTNQVVRECARFLSACATNLGPELLQVMPVSHKPVFHQTLQRLAQHTDANCRHHAKLIRRASFGEATD